ncbi:response regulator transcription factor [Erysipelothrix tonsillarum]|uniref:response regulator transcription factor n=1 Tax=Erysipelothrix tonsillarum TaxID=38402 RepID=UPI000367FE21|nr:response regulator transcription factor [Erysipelothrix tonsillarum]
MKKILVVDDDKEIRDLMKRYLEIDGYEVIVASDGHHALQLLNEQIKLVILDVMMPDLTGFEVSETIRNKYNVPILFVSAKATEQDKFVGFSVGGDDYLSKPFSFSELSLRVKSLLRRYIQYDRATEQPVDSKKINTIDSIKIDLEKGITLKDGLLLDLTEREFRILSLLATNRGKIFSIQSIYENVWQDEYLYSSANTVMVHIRNLRKKIETCPENPKIIKNIWGRGYKID